MKFGAGRLRPLAMGASVVMAVGLSVSPVAASTADYSVDLASNTALCPLSNASGANCLLPGSGQVNSGGSFTGGTSVEALGGTTFPGNYYITRSFGSTNKPVLTFTPSTGAPLTGLKFVSGHNHTNSNSVTSTGYSVQVQVDASGSGVWTNLGSAFTAARSATLTVNRVETVLSFSPVALTAGTAVKFRWLMVDANGAAAAVNTGSDFFGLGRFTATFDTTPPLAVPGAPSAPSAVAGDGQAEVTVVPAATGGPAESFLVTSSPHGLTCSIAASATPLACTIEGLANNTQYTFSAQAVNAAGTSASSAPSNAVVPNGAPAVMVDPANADGVEGDVLQTSGRFSDDPGDVLTITSNVTAGILDTADNGQWSWSLPTSDDVAGATATVTATDSQGLSVTSTFHYSATNAAPKATASLIAGINGCTVSVSGSVTDPGTADTHTGLITWGDGSSTNAVLTGSHTYAAAGSYQVVATVTDDDGASATGLSTTHRVLNGAALSESLASKYKVGKEVKLELVVTDCTGKVVPNLAPKVFLQLGSAAPIPATSLDKDYVGNTMGFHREDGVEDRDDPAAHRESELSTYEYSISTSKLTLGAWKVTIVDPSFATVRANLNITKN